MEQFGGILGGFCPGGFCPGGFCPRGDFVQGDFVRGILSGGFCPGGFCPRTKPGMFQTQFSSFVRLKILILLYIGRY